MNNLMKTIVSVGYIGLATVRYMLLVSLSVVLRLQFGESGGSRYSARATRQNALCR